MNRNTLYEYFKIIFAVLFIGVFIGSFALLQHRDIIYHVSGEDQLCDKVTIVIDAGHGGEDGGAIGLTGTLEKDINLDISKKLEFLFGLCGIDTVMTRTDDKLLYNEGQEGRKKFFDLHNRVKIANSIDNAFLVSIHQNKFPIEKYHGLQVYYAENFSQSEVVAEAIQKNTVLFLQNDNKRQIKRAGKEIFLLKNVNCPAVLVECGFLSNFEEENNLNNDEYRQKIATIIFSSIMQTIYS